MAVQSFLGEAFKRGEKMKVKFIEDVFHSRFINQLLKNENFLKAIVAVLNTKTGLEKKVSENVHGLLKIFDIPTKSEIVSMERKIHHLESEIDNIHRKALTQRLRQKASKKLSHRPKK